MPLMDSVDWTLLKKESELEDISLETNKTEKKKTRKQIRELQDNLKKEKVWHMHNRMPE